MEIMPGPNMAYLTILARGDGRRAGYAAVAGVALGLLLVGLASAMVGAAVAALLLAWQILRGAGVAYLLWLASDGGRGANEAPEHAARGSSLGRFFGRGLLTNLLNARHSPCMSRSCRGFCRPIIRLRPSVWPVADLCPDRHGDP